MRYAIGFLSAAIIALIFLSIHGKSKDSTEATAAAIASPHEKQYGWKEAKREVIAIGATDSTVIQGIPRAVKIKVTAESQTPVSFGLVPKDLSEEVRDPRTPINFSRMPCSATGALSASRDCTVTREPWVLLIADSRSAAALGLTAFAAYRGSRAASEQLVPSRATITISTWGCIANCTP